MKQAGAHGSTWRGGFRAEGEYVRFAIRCFVLHLKNCQNVFHVSSVPDPVVGYVALQYRYKQVRYKYHTVLGFGYLFNFLTSTDSALCTRGNEIALDADTSIHTSTVLYC